MPHYTSRISLVALALAVSYQGQARAEPTASSLVIGVQTNLTKREAQKTGCLTIDAFLADMRANKIRQGDIACVVGYLQELNLNEAIPVMYLTPSHERTSPEVGVVFSRQETRIGDGTVMARGRVSREYGPSMQNGMHYLDARTSKRPSHGHPKPPKAPPRQERLHPYLKRDRPV